MAIARIGATNTASATITGPSGAAGDIIVYNTFRSTAATIPTTPTGVQSIASSSGSTCAYNTAYEFCSSAGAPSARTFTGATQIVATRYSGVYGIGASSFAAIASSNIMSFGGLTLIQPGGTSWLVGMGAHRTATNVNTAPTGMSTMTNGSVGTGPQVATFDTNGNVTTWATQTVTVNATSGRVSNVIELLGANSTLNPYDKDTTVVLSAANLTGSNVTIASGQTTNVRGTLPHSSGKWVFAVNVSLGASVFLNITIATAAFVLNTYPGGLDTTNVDLYYFFSDGNSGCSGNNVQIGVNLPSWTTGVQMVAMDLTNKLLWPRINGVWYGSSGSPATPDSGLDGFAFSYIDAGPYYPCLCFGSTDGTTATFDGTAAGHGLTTFAPWDGLMQYFDMMNTNGYPLNNPIKMIPT